jgi:nicotinate-nucleotide pyrophosphorylase (carboxylating)
MSMIKESMDEIRDIITRALAEDIGEGDHTSMSCIPENATGSARLLVKEPGILAGTDVARMVFERVDPGLIFLKDIDDGSKISPGDIVFTVEGKARSILMAERLSLNILQRMSAIATRTAHYVSLIEGTNARILDTRKTTPNLRVLEKNAVKAGGGYNHRMGLYDMIMIKDNHVDFAGGIKKAISQSNQYLKEKNLDIPIEIEVRNLEELREVLEMGNIHRIMFDNFTLADLAKGVELVDGRFETEASGGITENTIRDVALTGVDFISVGALTHNIKSLDMSLKAVFRL